MGGRFVGLYWTLPVTWAGFTTLDRDGLDVDAAAMASRTIRYQREVIRRWVAEEKGELIGEVAFMDTRTDRATEAVRDVLERRVPTEARRGASLVAVEFSNDHNWRPNPFLWRAARTLGMRLERLPPDPILIGGKLFHPARHFAEWRKRDRSVMTRLRLEAYAGLRTSLSEVPDGEGRWRQVADALNGRGTRTVRGGTWTAENVRKLAGRLRLG